MAAWRACIFGACRWSEASGATMPAKTAGVRCDRNDHGNAQFLLDLSAFLLYTYIEVKGVTLEEDGGLPPTLFFPYATASRLCASMMSRGRLQRKPSASGFSKTKAARAAARIIMAQKRTSTELSSSIAAQAHAVHIVGHHVHLPFGGVHFLGYSLIKNLGIEDLNINITNNAGGICVSAWDSSILNCYTTGTITVSSPYNVYAGWTEAQYPLGM